MPESTHMLMWVMSDRAIPLSYRFVNAEGVSTFVKFHWNPLLGTHSLVWDEAVKIAGADPDFHRAIGVGGELLARCGIPAALDDGGEDPGVLIANGSDMDATSTEFIEALGAHRHWERDSDPPRFEFEARIVQAPGGTVEWDVGAGPAPNDGRR